jgi:AcrR family transcriptional regulator
VPKLWRQTIEAHRNQVSDAILETTWALVAERGLRSVTMAEIAEKAGIGRATLYKYFPDVDAILVAWHQRHITGHLERLAALREQAGDPGQRLEAVLAEYAAICFNRGDHGELAALLHQREHVAVLQQRLVDLVRDLLAEAAATGAIRDDVAPAELASFCVHALGAAGTLRSRTAVNRLVAVTLSALRP